LPHGEGNLGIAAGEVAAIAGAEGRGGHARLRTVSHVAADLEQAIAVKRSGQGESGAEIGLITDTRGQRAVSRGNFEDAARIGETALRAPVAPLWASGSAANRSTGRVDEAVRRTHFQSSLMRLPLSTDGYASWMVLNSVFKFTLNTLRMPGCTRMFFLSAGTKVASVTLTE